MSYQKKPVLIRGTVSRAEQPNIALASAAFVVMAAVTQPAFAAESAKKAETDKTDVTQLEGVTAQAKKAEPGSNPNADPEAPYKIDKSANGKFTEPLLNVSKTINVVGKEQMKDAGVSALKDLMRTQPGITLGTGENGNQEGDRFYIRGFDARSDTFVDGMREPGMTARETFATEQIEVTKGPSSTFGGRGTTGGAVNIVSKKAQDTDFTRGTLTLGTEKRTTLDANKVVNDKLKIRANVMLQDSNVAGRDEVFKKGHGVALAADYQATDKVNVKVDLYHLRNEAMPDRGQPYNAVVAKLYGDVDRNNFYGYKNRDFWNTGADSLTTTVDAKLSDNTSVTNTTRIGETANDYIVSNPANVSGTLTVTPGTTARRVKNKLVANNTMISHEFHASNNVEHNIVAGVEVSEEKVKVQSGTVSGTNTPLDLYNPNNSATGATVTFTAAPGANTAKSQSLYLMDTAKLNEKWEVFGGIRQDQFDIEKRQNADVYNPLNNQDVEVKKDFTNGHLGLVYKPKENGSIYGSISTSSNIPSEALDATNPNYGGINVVTKDTAPEKNKSFELGTKWNLANDDLALSAAIFRTEKKNKIEVVSNTPMQTGEVRVDGVELGVSGNVTPKLSLSGGIVYMDTEITNSATASNIGKKLGSIAEKSASIQAKYQATPKLALGGTVVHTGKFKGSDGSNFAANDARVIPVSNRLDVMAEYKINKKLSTQLNVKNATDKTIIDASYPSGFTYIAPGRTTNVSLTYDF
ncbi:MAG TPA: TonB-dependent siderophore receptor [Candidatus Thiothrix moscowensis]|uniref:TonB-dependent receptor n=1 Tax=unclassified Thiothrix TaxID=2636184 RepID=UPI0025FF51B1|nr:MULTISPECIES: TonB-dependent siderophore receptor [unclassified Thiothrix]HRJ52531.1 TonB-dependent siderophore receptor [Candidatus Thiothrix moscowensis]HRJ93283.1 TonB-dependent siderophore receptor [Candidatus Thiothrix moscowensis]